MTLIVEDGTGVENANAYIDAAFVNEYLVARNRIAENGWESATDEAKSAAIIKATDYIETAFGTRFQGYLEESDQALSFPRDLFKGIPARLKKATAEYAIRALVENLIPDPESEEYSSSLRVRREKIGPLEEEYQYSSGSGPRGLSSYPAADKLLVPLLIPGGREFRA